MRFGVVLTLVLFILSACSSSTGDEALVAESPAQSSNMSSDVAESLVVTTPSDGDENITAENVADDAPDMVEVDSSDDETLETESPDQSSNTTSDTADGSDEDTLTGLDLSLDGDDSDQAGVITDPMARVGVFSLERINNTDETVVRSSASFHIFDPSLGLTSASEEVEAIRADDACFVAKNGVLLNRGLKILPSLYLSDRVSAGETLTLSSPSGTYATVNRVRYSGPNVPDNPPILYSANSLTAPVPDDLTLSVPGDTFPAYNELAIPNIPAITGQSPTTASDVRTDSVFTWDANGNENAIIGIYAAYIPESGSENSELVIVTCEVKDDGYFAFPESTKVELGSGFVATEYKLMRSLFDVVNDGDTYLVLYNGEVPY